MTMKQFIYLMFVAMAFVACSDDDYVKPTFTSSSIDGDWLMYDESGASAMEMSLTSKGFSYAATTYINLRQGQEVYDNLYGYYAFITSNQSLRIQINSERNEMINTNDFSVQNVDDFTLSLYNKKLCCDDVYCRIVAKHETIVGKTISNDYLSSVGFSATEFDALDESVVIVDASGNITTKGVGTTFVIAKNGDKKIAVKVVVVTQVENYVSYIYQSTIDDIIMSYGQPDVEGAITDASSGILYKQPSFDPNLESIQFNYDNTSRLVTRILTVYKDETTFCNDYIFIDNTYIIDESDPTLYYDADDFLKSRVMLSPFIKDNKYYISYNSSTYFMNNKHY